MQKYCFQCMRPLEASPVCRHCGHNNSNKIAVAPYHLNPGTVLGNRYLIGNVLGEGGFGITYIGLDMNLGKRVAVKEFYPAGVANRINDKSADVLITQGREDFFTKGVDRFLFEAQSVAAFSDEEGIVDVLDHFRDNNTAYIVMAFLDGQTLKDYVSKNGPFEADRLIKLMLPVMKSLKVMHVQGVIHRDISPDNIMYTKSGKLKLMDFGSARYYTNEERQMSVVLKQGFAPEEQYRRNGKQGPFTDVYALCATIYACITGVVPTDSLDRLANDTLRPPSQLGVRISRVQENALMHGLALLPQNRCQNMEALIREFTAAPNSAAATMDANAYSQSYLNAQQQTPPQNPNRPMYGQNMPNNGYPNNAWQQPNRPPYPPQNYPMQPEEPKKSNAAVIVAIIATVTAILVVGGILAFIFLFNNNGGGSSDNSSSASDAVTTTVAASGDNRANQTTTAPPETTREKETTVPPTTVPPTTVPPTTEHKKMDTMTKSEIDSRVNDIADGFSDTIQYIDDQKKVGGYAVTQSDANHTWIAYPSTTMVDDRSNKIWYFFDQNDKLYFIFEHNSTDYYRYYVYNDEIIRYTVGDTGDQVTYDHNDSSIPSSASLRISDAYEALKTVKG